MATKELAEFVAGALPSQLHLRDPILPADRLRRPFAARSNGRSNCQRVWIALSITNSLACIPWEAPMTLPPTDPTDPDPDPDLDLMLAGAEELSEEELAGLAEPADEDLAKLDERLDEEIARLRDPDARADWYADPDDDYAAESTPLFGGGFAEGGVLDGLEPGPALAGFSQGAVDEGLTRLSDDELVGVLRASWRLSAWQAGVELAAVAELDHRRARAAERPGSSLADEHVAAELAAALVLTGRSADALLGLARDLARLPAVRKALLEGRIDRARAVVFAAELAGLGDIAAAAVAMGFAGIAGSMTTGQLRAARSEEHTSELQSHHEIV